MSHHCYCVRVPVYNSHIPVEINVTFEKIQLLKKFDSDLWKAPGVIVCQIKPDGVYPTPLQATGHDEVYVGRPAATPTKQLHLRGWHIRKGAASNAIQIAEYIGGERLCNGE